METGIITTEQANVIREGGIQTIVIPEPQESSPDVLRTTSNVGQFVHDNQVMGGKRGFKNVSGLWLDKCITIEQGLNMMAEQRKEREDITVPSGNVEFSSDDKGVVVIINDREFRPTEHALKGLCNWFPTPSTLVTYYLNPPNNGKYQRDADDYDVVAYALENGRRRIDAKKELMFRTYKDGTLRAVMSDSYSIVDNEWYLKLIAAIMPDAMLSHWRGDADTIFGNVLIPDSIRAETDSDFGGMLSIGNSEIGMRTISQLPSVFCAICMNGCIWDQQKGVALIKRHKGLHLDDLAKDIKANIDKQIPLLNSGIDHLLMTRQWMTKTNLVKVFAAIGKEYKLPATLMGKCALEWNAQGKKASCYGVIDALTRVGQTEDNQTWVAMDSLAGSMMKQANWNYVDNVANLFKSNEEVLKYVAV